MVILDHVILFENSANFNFIVCGCSKPHLFTYEYSYIFGVNKWFLTICLRCYKGLRGLCFFLFCFLCMIKLPPFFHLSVSLSFNLMILTACFALLFYFIWDCCNYILISSFLTIPSPETRAWQLRISVKDMSPWTLPFGIPIVLSTLQNLSFVRLLLRKEKSHSSKIEKIFIFIRYWRFFNPMLLRERKRRTPKFLLVYPLLLPSTHKVFFNCKYGFPFSRFSIPF